MQLLGPDNPDMQAMYDDVWYRDKAHTFVDAFDTIVDRSTRSITWNWETSLQIFTDGLNFVFAQSSIHLKQRFLVNTSWSSSTFTLKYILQIVSYLVYLTYI